MSSDMDASIPKLPSTPQAGNELRPHPRGDRSRGRGRFVLGDEEEATEVSTTEEGSHVHELPVSPHDADEAGSRLDLTA